MSIFPLNSRSFVWLAFATLVLGLLYLWANDRDINEQSFDLESAKVKAPDRLTSTSPRLSEDVSPLSSDRNTNKAEASNPQEGSSRKEPAPQSEPQTLRGTTTLSPSHWEAIRSAAQSEMKRLGRPVELGHGFEQYTLDADKLLHSREPLPNLLSATGRGYLIAKEGQDVLGLILMESNDTTSFDLSSLTRKPLAISLEAMLAKNEQIEGSFRWISAFALSLEILELVDATSGIARYALVTTPQTPAWQRMLFESNGTWHDAARFRELLRTALMKEYYQDN